MAKKVHVKAYVRNYPKLTVKNTPENAAHAKSLGMAHSVSKSGKTLNVELGNAYRFASNKAKLKKSLGF